MNDVSRRLVRSDDRIIAGVCGGIAAYFGWRPRRTRVAYVLLSIFSTAFPGILVYILLWIVMPSTDEVARATLGPPAPPREGQSGPPASAMIASGLEGGGSPVRP